jgi:Zn-dependent peptidase ImmA (M78 family)
LDPVLRDAFDLHVSDELVDDCFSAFFLPLPGQVLVNPQLAIEERVHAILHELGHYLIERSQIRADAAGSAQTLDGIFHCDLFETLVGEKTVNWVAVLLALPDPLPGVRTIDVDLPTVLDIAGSMRIPLEFALCRILLYGLSGVSVAISSEDESRLVARCRNITYYW